MYHLNLAFKMYQSLSNLLKLTTGKGHSDVVKWTDAPLSKSISCLPSKLALATDFECSDTFKFNYFKFNFKTIL